MARLLLKPYERAPMEEVAARWAAMVAQVCQALPPCTCTHLGHAAAFSYAVEYGSSCDELLIAGGGTALSGRPAL